MTDAERDELLGGIRPLIRGALWCAGAALAVAGALYAVFWLPYREPEEPPYPVPILPRPPERGPLTRQEPAQGYEWVDRDKGIVRVPIEDAMRITAERLVVRKKGAGEPEGRVGGPPPDGGSGRLPSAPARKP